MHDHSVCITIVFGLFLFFEHILESFITLAVCTCVCVFVI